MKLRKSFLVMLLFFALPVLPVSGDNIDTDGEKVHVVVKGDTLWGISGKYLGNTFLWPKLWQWNDFITNPHFIYPGDKISIFPPAVVVRQKIEAPVEEVVEEAVEEVVEEVEVAEVVEIKPVRIGVPYNIRHLRSSGFVTPGELEKAGKILDAVDAQRVMLSLGHIIYISLKTEAKIGDKYMAFKPTSEIIHPITKASLGHKVDRLGNLVIKSFSKNLAVAEIIEVFDVMERGNLVQVIEELPEEIEIKYAEKSVEGHIVGSKEGEGQFGERDVVYIDLGTDDGIETGNVFIAYKPERKHIENKEEEYTIPAETIGRLLVFEAKEKTSSAVIVNTVQELIPGERIKSEIQ